MEKNKNKVKRPDLILRIQNNKLIDFSVIKTTWKGFCKENTFLTFPIENILRNINKATYEAYKLANLHVVRLACWERNTCLRQEILL